MLLSIRQAFFVAEVCLRAGLEPACRDAVMPNVDVARTYLSQSRSGANCEIYGIKSGKHKRARPDTAIHIAVRDNDGFMDSQPARM